MEFSGSCIAPIGWSGLIVCAEKGGDNFMGHGVVPFATLGWPRGSLQCRATPRHLRPDLTGLAGLFHHTHY